MNKMPKIVALALAPLALLAGAQPGHARDSFAAATASAAVSQDAKARGGSSRADAEKHCLTLVPDTGSRIAKRECRTKREWAEDGIKIVDRK